MFTIEEMTHKLRDTYNFDFDVRDNGEEHVLLFKTDNIEYGLGTFLPKEISNLDDLVTITSDMLYEVLKNALNVRNHKYGRSPTRLYSQRSGVSNKFVSLDREFIFGTSHRNQWLQRICGDNASTLRALFYIDHRSTSDGVYNTVTYTPKITGFFAAPLAIMYVRHGNKIEIDPYCDLIHCDTVYKGLLNNNMEKDKITLTLATGQGYGLHIDGTTGIISMGSGLHPSGDISDIMLIEMSDTHAVLYHLHVHGYSAAISLYKYTIHVDVETNVVMTDSDLSDDFDLFPWVKEMKTPYDCDFNPITRNSSYGYIFKDAMPLYESESLWISPRNNMYIRDGSAWIPLNTTLSEALKLEKYLPPSAYRELQRYALAMELSSGAPISI